MGWSKERFQQAAAFRPAKRRPMPRPMEPIGLMNLYLRRINIMRADMAAVVRKHVLPALEEVAANPSRLAQDSALTDIVLDSGKVGDSIDRAQDEFKRRWPRSKMAQVVEPISVDVPKFNANQLNRQLSSLIGDTISLDIVGSEAWLASAAQQFVSENVALIKSIPDTFFPDLEKHLTREIADGARFEELASMLEDRYKVTAAQAQRIARDQIGKYNGDLNRVRQVDLGIDSFRWRTMGDERVRTDKDAGAGEGHVERNGKVYSWKSPPNGEQPGEPIQCRCYGEPVLTEEAD
jgi:SPP1 gp7 family putative phage head morphogenesis protein